MTSRRSPLINLLKSNVVILQPHRTIRHQHSSRRLEGMLWLPTYQHHHGPTVRGLTALGSPPHTPSFHHQAQAPRRFVLCLLAPGKHNGTTMELGTTMAMECGVAQGGGGTSSRRCHA